jgi:transcriptional regulator with XRE-family HTH domain
VLAFCGPRKFKVPSVSRRTKAIIGDRLRSIREGKKLSQGDVEKRTGSLSCYISRVENGHTVPAVETIEKLARALEIPVYQLFYDGNKPPELPNLPKRKTADDIAWGSAGKDARFLSRFRPLLGTTSDRDRKLLMAFAPKIASKHNGRKSTADSDYPEAGIFGIPRSQSGENLV